MINSVFASDCAIFPLRGRQHPGFLSQRYNTKDSLIKDRHIRSFEYLVSKGLALLSVCSREPACPRSDKIRFSEDLYDAGRLSRIT